MTIREQRFKTVQSLRRQGFSYSAVATILGISESYVREIVSDPTGSKDKARKESYRGTCEVCGRQTSGSNGPAKAPKICAECIKLKAKRNPKWTRENVVDAIQRFAAENGRPPKVKEWIRGNPEKCYPPASSIYNGNYPFRSWSEAVEAAGFPRPGNGKYERTESSVAKLRNSLQKRNREIFERREPEAIRRLVEFYEQYGDVPRRDDTKEILGVHAESFKRYTGLPYMKWASQKLGVSLNRSHQESSVTSNTDDTEEFRGWRFDNREGKFAPLKEKRKPESQ